LKAPLVSSSGQEPLAKLEAIQLLQAGAQSLGTEV